MTFVTNHGPLHFLAEIAVSCSKEQFLNEQTTDYQSDSTHSPLSSITISNTQGNYDLQPHSHNRHSSISKAGCLNPSGKYANTPKRRKTRKPSQVQLRMKLQVQNRRNELMGRALKIQSLDNSPVNDRQLLVLRMVYDEITTYPSESWMVVLAVIINRAFKQVKNWFSNERQKSRSGDIMIIETEDGDKVKMRPAALQYCKDWSDKVFEEVVMIFHFKLLRNAHS